MAAELSFSFDDLWDEDSGLAAAEREQHKFQPNQLKTSASTQGRSTTVSTLTTAEMMMQIPVYKSGADALSSVEKVTESYTAATIAAEDNLEGNLGPADDLVPPDTKELAQRIRDERAGKRTTNDPPVPGDPDSGSGTSTPGEVTQEGGNTTTSGARLLSNPNCSFQGSGGGTAARRQIEQGKLSPNMIFILSKITQQIKIFISSGNTGQHAPNSLHYSNRAIDIGSIQDAATGESDGFTSGNKSAVTLKLYDILNSITGPRRPTKVGGPFNPGWSDGRTIWFSDAAHGNHMHIEHAVVGEPMAPPPVTSGPLKAV